MAHAGGHAAHDKHAGHSEDDRAEDRRDILRAGEARSRVAEPLLEVRAPDEHGERQGDYGGLVFLRRAAGELRDRQPGMMTLISLAIIVAFVTSWAGSLGLFEVEIWWELATLITVMLLGHWLEMRSIDQARGALTALAELLPDAAERVNDDGTETVPLAALAVGDVVLVRPGSRVPADGVVVEGAADVDESLITGESRAVAK